MWAPLKQRQQGVLHVPKWNQGDQNEFSSLECGSGTSFTRGNLFIVLGE